jgi:hypothetical protein
MAKNKKNKPTTNELTTTDHAIVIFPARRYRDSLTGRFVTKKYAKKNRKTTIKEATA